MRKLFRDFRNVTSGNFFAKNYEWAFLNSICFQLQIYEIWMKEIINNVDGVSAQAFPNKI